MTVEVLPFCWWSLHVEGMPSTPLMDCSAIVVTADSTSFGVGFSDVDAGDHVIWGGATGVG